MTLLNVYLLGAVLCPPNISATVVRWVMITASSEKTEVVCESGAGHGYICLALFLNRCSYKVRKWCFPSSFDKEKD